MRQRICTLVALSFVLGSSVTAQTTAPTTIRDAAAREAVRLASARTVQAATSTPHRSWAGRHPVVLGTLIGFAGGVVYATPGCSRSSDYTCTGLGLFFGGVGAGLGAGAGGIVALFQR